jgi:hypothetical protein
MTMTGAGTVPRQRPLAGPRQLALVTAAFTMATIVMTWPLWQHPTHRLPSDLVDTLLNTWILGWDADRMLHGFRGLWDAPIYFPYHNTLAFSENLLGLAVFVAPITWVTGNPVLAYTVGFTASFVLAGVGMYALLATLSGSAICACVGAVYYAFCPFRFLQISHVQVVDTGWLPLALLALHRYFADDDRRWLAAFAAATAIQVLCNAYVAYFMLLPFGAVAIDGLRRDRARVRHVVELAAATVVVAIALWPVAAHYVRVRADYGQVRRRDEMRLGSADVQSYVSGNPNIGIWRWLRAGVHTEEERDLFPGFVVLVLAAASARWLTRAANHARRWVLVYGAVTLAAVVLSFGPELYAWGRLVTTHMPYDWLLRVVPGMDGMRVTARFALVVSLGLSVLAGFGASAIAARLRATWRVTLATMVVMLMCAESWVVPMTVYSYSGRGRPEDRAVADWLVTRPAGAVLHLPVMTYNFQELNYQYATLFHQHPIVNGMTGYASPLQMLFREPWSPLYDAERPAAVVRMLRALGVRYVVVHAGDYNMTQLDRGEHHAAVALMEASGQVVAEDRFLDTRAFELSAPTTPPAVEDPSPIESNRLRVTVSDTSDRASFLVDGDPDTRWFATQGASWFALTVDRPTDIARVDLTLADRSVADYPRELAIDATGPDGIRRTLLRVTPYAEFILGFVRNPHYPRIELPLTANRTSILTVRAIGDAHGRWWSVHEVQLWARRYSARFWPWR